MKKILFFAVLMNFAFMAAQTPCSGGSAGSYPCNGLTLQSFISLSSMGATSGNDSWGWTDPQTGKEYALMGVNNGTVFIDISNPTNPKNLGKLRSHNSSSSLWRDIKTYNNHAFIVSEANGHGMQVFDLTRLRGLSANPSRTFSEDAHYGAFGKSHNIVINEETGYAYVVGSGLYSGGPHFINIQNPTNPTNAGGYSGDGYTHDAQVIVYHGPDPDYQGREILIGSNESKVVIMDITNKNNPIKISSLSYSNYNYTHQGWFTEDERYFILGDEEDEVHNGFNTRTLVFDFNDLDAPTLKFTYYGPTAAIDHNGYVRKNRFYLANYEAGVRIIKISDIASGVMTEINSFDTYPEANSANFHGVWNIYPYFESGNLLVSDYTRGFFLLKDPNYDNTDPVAICKNITATLTNSGSVTITANMLDNGSTDNKGIVKRTISKTTFTCHELGPNLVDFTVEDDYGNKSTCTATVTVVAPTTRYISNAWNNGAPHAGSNARISQDYDTSAKGSIDACTCQVDANRTLTVAAEDYLKVTKDITVNGNLIVQHKGSVVQEADNAVVTNNGTINVNYTTPYMVPRVFVVMGSPMTAETRNGAFGNSYMFLNHLTENFVPNPDVAAQFPLAENFADDNYDNWVNYTGAINPGEGYIARPQLNGNDGNKTYDMTFEQGTLNTGDVAFTVKYNGSRNSSPNVLANPYPSAISAVDFINANAMVNEVYFWNPNTPPSPLLPGAYTMNFSMEDISMYNLMGGTPAPSDPTQTDPSGYISTGQGFGIKATAAGVATFSNAMRVTGHNNTANRPLVDGNNRIWVQVKNDQYQMQNNTLIGFSTLTTAGMDEGYDSRRLATVLSLYTHFDDGSKELGIQSREVFEDGAKVLMGFSSLLDENLEYTISIKDIQGPSFDNVTVFLIDNERNITTNLSQESYTFKAEKGTYNSRFTLQFRSNEVLGDATSALDKVSVFPNPTSSLLNIISPEAKVSTLEIFDVSGRSLKRVDLSSNTYYQIDLSSLQSAVYFVKISTDMGAITKQIIKQ
ncbi:choice-of-anchor B family protein [Aequorivita todarodis]|uniref:choice-of-anchor B family protein n=1 Tax=Aequorivita todarodis TaxID=2036821 RepID=UPI00300FA324